MKKDFPIFKNRPELIYFDNAASAQKPQVVIDVMKEFDENHYSNIHRGPHFMADEATEAYESARDTVGKFIGAKYSREIIFTRNATESINLVVKSYGELLEDGDEVVLSKMEHHANIVPWLQLKEKKNITLKYFDVSEDGELIFDESLITNKTKIVAITGMSNVLGTIPDLKPIIKKVHEVGGKILVDACQSVVHQKIDVQEMDIDFLVFSAHKLYGPTGVGVLYGKEELLNNMPPFLGGGDMIQEVQMDKYTFTSIPNKFEAGTPNITGAIGLEAAIKYIENIGFDKIQEHERELTEYLFENLAKLPFIKIIGPKDTKGRGSVVSFLMDDVHPHDIAEGLSDKRICIRAGQHCAQVLMDHLQIPATARFSFGIYNTKEEIDKSIKVLEEVYKYFN